MADEEDDEVVIIDDDDNDEAEEEAPAEDGNLTRVTSAGVSEPLSALAGEEGDADGEPAEPAQPADAAEAPQEPAAPERPLVEVEAEFQVEFVKFWLSRGQAPPEIGVTWWRHDSMNLSWAIWFAVQARAGLCVLCPPPPKERKH